MENIELTSTDGIQLEAAIHVAEVRPAIGAVILAHGITGDMHEEGLFVRLAERLSLAGFDVLRFSYRGHGRSGSTQRGVTIAGELLDFQAAVDVVRTKFNPTISVVAYSFAAVGASLSLSYLENTLRSLVLWNPVPDLKKSFVQPDLPWAQANFNAESVRQLSRRGYLLLDGAF